MIFIRELKKSNFTTKLPGEEGGQLLFAVYFFVICSRVFISYNTERTEVIFYVKKLIIAWQFHFF